MSIVIDSEGIVKYAAMSYLGKEMEIGQELERERRARLIDPNDPQVKKLWEIFKATIEKSVKPGVNANQLTESLLITALQFAYRDSLSGLLSKKGAAIELEAAVAVAKRLNIPMSILSLDAENFKGANDQLGHAAGDRIIEAMGEALNKSVRSTDTKLRLTETENDSERLDTAGRHGGDEFVVVLWGANLQGTRVVAERIHQSISRSVDEKVPEYRQKFGRSFGVTIGMAQFDPNIDRDGVMLLARADQDLTLKRQARGETRRS